MKTTMSVREQVTLMGFSLTSFLINLTLCFFALSSAAWANGYCDTRRTQQEYNQCYQGMVETNSRIAAQAYKALLASPRYTQAQKQNLEANQAEWMQRLQTGCANNWKCYDESVIARGAALRTELNRVNGR